jgi:hypothetical protein
MIIGEFHFGALDRGLPHTGLRSVINQEQRARAYTYYFRQALEHDRIVGAHWFQYSDQVVTGRFDGENYQIGFVDIVDRPYPEMVAASRKLGEYFYDYRLTGTVGAEQKRASGNHAVRAPEISMYRSPGGRLICRLRGLSPGSSSLTVSLHRVSGEFLGRENCPGPFHRTYEIEMPVPGVDAKSRGMNVYLVGLRIGSHAFNKIVVLRE